MGEIEKRDERKEKREKVRESLRQSEEINGNTFSLVPFLSSLMKCRRAAA
jgi:hypothetical protein